MHKLLLISVLLVLALSGSLTAADTMLFFTSKTCGPCHRVKDREFPKLVKFGYQIVDFGDIKPGMVAHIIVVDMDDYPEFSKLYAVDAIPQFYKLRNGNGSRLVGYQSAEAISKFYRSN